MVVEHADLHITEIVAYDPAIDREAPRIYVDSDILLAKLDHGDIVAQLGFGQRNGVLITEETLTNKAKFDFIVSRLLISEYAVNTKTIMMTFQPGNEGLCCSKPEALIPYRSPHYHTLMEGVVERAMGALNRETSGLRQATEAARVYEENVHKALNIRERWRIPIVFIKVSKNRRLSPKDMRIWQKVTANMKTEEDAALMAAVLSPQTSTTANSSFDFAADVVATKTASTVAYVAAAPVGKVSKTASSPRHVAPLQKTPSRLAKQRSVARLKVDEEDGPAPTKISPSPSNARLLTRGGSVRQSSFRSATTDVSPKGRASAKYSSKYGSKVAAGPAGAERETTVTTQPEASAQTVLGAVVQSLRASFGMSSKSSKVQPVVTVVTTDSEQTVSDSGGYIPCTTAESAATTAFPTVDVTAGEQELDVTPLDNMAPTAKPVVTSRKKASSFLLSLLQSLSVSTHPASGSSFLYSADAAATAVATGDGRQAADHSAAGGSAAEAAAVQHSRFPLVQMVLAGLLGNTSASEKCT